MKNKNRLIIGLLIVGIALFSIVQFVIVPQYNAKAEQYLSEQLEATTHDINYILPYKNEYMGNNSNMANLFLHLPLATSKMKFQLFPDSFTIQVDYEDTLLNVGKESAAHKSLAASGSKDELNQIYENEVEKSLIYNSTAAFALIDNLEHIIYHFSDVSYKVDRDEVEVLYNEFAKILNEANWKSEVQNPLKDSGHVADIAKEILSELE